MNVNTIRLAWRHQVLLGATGALLLAVLCVRFVYLPVWARINERRARLQDLTVKVADAQVLIAQRPAQAATLDEARTRYRELEARFGEGPSVATILETLGAQAKEHKLELVAIQPRSETKGQRVVVFGPELKVREVPLTLQLTGRYQHVGEFLGALPRCPFFTLVRALTLAKPDTDVGQLTANLELAVYLVERGPA